MIDNEQNNEYIVVVNHEEQYSLWPARREIPSGWKHVGRNGTKQDCLNWIKKNWTDMRPLSIR
jgi:MbtH protein